MEKRLLMLCLFTIIVAGDALGQVLIEAESVPAKGMWKLSTAKSAYSGTGYLEWIGSDYFDIRSIPQDSILAYHFNLPESGEYVVEVRGRRDKEGVCAGEADDQCNDIWMEVNGKWVKKMVKGAWGAWIWDNAYEMQNVVVEQSDFHIGVVKAEFTLKAGQNTIRISGRSKGVKLDSIRITKAPKYKEGDLVSIHFDNAADPDDALAAAADYSVVHKLGINVLVVNGAAGMNMHNYVTASETVMDAVWGEGNWLNANNDWEGSVRTAASRWLAILDSGGDIWVAESGQSDFTADVIKRIKSIRSGLSIKSRIRVVQHSAWNEKYTTPADFSYVKYQAGEYIHIDDGNHGGNTADLNQRHDNWFVEVATGHAIYGAGWKAAFDYYTPRRYGSIIDFSDTVELLYILDIPVSEVGGINDFAYAFLMNEGGSECIPSCQGKTCGDNGCGGSCGTCSSGTCIDYRCQEIIGARINKLILINADTNTDIIELKEGMQINLGALPTRNLNVRADTDPKVVGSVRFGLGTNQAYRTENVWPYALEGDEDGNYNAWKPSAGTYTIKATPYTSANAAGTEGISLGIEFIFAEDTEGSGCIPSCQGKTCGDNGCGGSCGTCSSGACIDYRCQEVIGTRVTKFTLINADTNTDIIELKEGMQINLGALPTRNLNVRADTDPKVVGSVRFGLGTNHAYRTENVWPYALEGDVDGNYTAWKPTAGSYTIKATPYTSANAAGTEGISLRTEFTVVEGTANCPDLYHPFDWNKNGIADIEDVLAVIRWWRGG